MRQALWLAPLLVPLAGCYMPAGDYGYGAAQQPYGYAQPYPQPYDPYAAAPGYSYNDGAPVIVEGGASVPLVFFGGEWGFYDRERRWHRAPEHAYRDLERRRESGAHFHPDAMPRGEPREFRGAEQRQQAPAMNHQHFEPAQQQRPQASFFPQPHAAPSPQPQRTEEHERRRDCPPGQRC